MTATQTNWTLYVAKAALAGAAIALDLSGKLSPQGGLVVVTLLGALGVTHAAAILRSPALSHELIDRISGVVIALLSEARKTTIVNVAPSVPPPAPPAAPAAPPGAPSVVEPIIWASGALAAAAMLVGCPIAGLPSPAEVDAYRAEQVGCSSDQNGSREAADDCRGKSRAAWCARFPTAGNCTDGGVR